jgi:2'-5' RNA ligase
MKQVINILIKNPRIEILRKKYDHVFRKVKTHVTLVYPFEIKDHAKLVEHIEYCLAGMAPFEIVLDKLRKSRNYLVLDVGKNQEKLLNLHKKLNSGILSGFENKELSIYLPHITLGMFDSHEELMKVINELRERGSNFRVIVDKISLLTLNDDGSAKEITNFALK